MLRSPYEIKAGTALPPNDYAARNAYVRRMRDLWNGKFEIIDTDLKGLNSPNWFKRVVTVYADFLFGQRPVLVAGATERVLDELNASTLWDAVYMATIDMLRYGRGVVAPDVLADGDLAWMVYERDHHYEVWDRWDRPTGDVLVDVQGPVHDRRATVVYFVGAPSSVRRFRYQGIALGAEFNSMKFRGVSGRSVVTADYGYADDLGGVSIYEGIEADVGEVARVWSGMSETLKANQRPHLYGPSSVLREDENGNRVVDVKGQYFPLDPEDQRPGYLQWDSKSDAIRLDIDDRQTNIFGLTGLSPLLFDPTIQGSHSSITGTALRRLLLPFYSRSQQIKVLVERMVVDMLELRGRWLGVSDVALDDILIEWPSDEFWQDPDSPSDISRGSERLSGVDTGAPDDNLPQA